MNVCEGCGGDPGGGGGGGGVGGGGGGGDGEGGLLGCGVEGAGPKVDGEEEDCNTKTTLLSP